MQLVDRSCGGLHTLPAQSWCNTPSPSTAAVVLSTRKCCVNVHQEGTQLIGDKELDDTRLVTKAKKVRAAAAVRLDAYFDVAEYFNIFTISESNVID